MKIAVGGIDKRIEETFDRIEIIFVFQVTCKGGKINLTLRAMIMAGITCFQQKQFMTN